MIRIRLLLARAALVAGFATALFPAQEGKREPDPALLAAQRAVADVTAQIPSPLDSLAEARSLVERNRFTEAERLVRRYLDTHRASAEGHFLLGYVLFKQRKAKESLAEYTLGLAKKLITPQGRATAGFDDPVAVPDDASALDQLIAFTGRDPAAQA